MSVRSRLAEAPVPVAKVFGPGVPPAIEAAEARSHMTPSSPFGPGGPIGPYDGFSRTPRTREFVTSVNTSARPRSHERVSFETLRSLIRSYDVAQICVRHRIASLRSLDYKLISADGYEGDVTAEIAEGKRVLKRPDRKTLFKPWLAKYLRDVLSYDAGTLYKMRNRAGRPVGLKVVDGTTIAPMLDYWGDSPDAPAPAYVQYVNGLPWNWLTRDDLIYEPYDPQSDSIYGLAPMEDVLLNSNTDIRFQLYFLQRFTEGNLPAAFASAPESWSPEQIEQFQELWDAFMAGDQSRKHQIRWLPPGSKIAWSNEKDFSDSFSLFLMRKTCASFSVVPADLGFTESVNRSSGESQADVQHRVGDLPLAHHVQDILTAFLQEDLQLPLQFSFDLGEEQDDRVAQAQADLIYMDRAVVGPSEIREMRYGRSDPVPIPRTFYTERAGPIPIASLMAVAGQIDPATALPEPGSQLPREVFGGTEGVLPNPPIKVMSLAEREFGEAAMPPAPPPQPKMTAADETPALPTAPAAPVAKEGEGAAVRPCAHLNAEPVDLITGERVAWVCPECDAGLPADWQLPAGTPVAKEGDGGTVTAGITSETGLVSYDLVHDDDEDEEAIAKEMSAFRRFAKARRKAGQWRDFEFAAVSAGDARRLNAEGRGSVAKAATGYELSPRSGMISLDLPPGTVGSVPGGTDDHHVTVVYLGPDVGDDAFAAACDRARQAAASVPGPLSGTVSGIGAFPPSDSSDGKVPAWAAIAIPGAEKLREALQDLSASEHKDWAPHVTLAYLDPGGPLPAPLEPVPVTFTCLSVHRGEDVALFPLGGEDVAKAVSAGPKAPAPSGSARDWHGWTLDQKTAAHWAPKVRGSVTAALPKAKARDLGRDYLAAHPGQDGKAPGKRDRSKAAAAWLGTWLATRGITLVPASLGQGVVTDGYAIGAMSAEHQVTGKQPGGQSPGNQDSARKRVEEAGLAAVLAALLHGGNGTAPAAEAVAEAIAAGYARSLAIILAGTDADWAGSQETLDELGDILSSALADEETAVTLVGTEINIYTGLAAHDYYMANSVAWKIWVTVRDGHVCPRCGENEDAGPIPVDERFPDGHMSTPGHARCRCACFPSGPPGA